MLQSARPAGRAAKTARTAVPLQSLMARSGTAAKHQHAVTNSIQKGGHGLTSAAFLREPSSLLLLAEQLVASSLAACNNGALKAQLSHTAGKQHARAHFCLPARPPAQLPAECPSRPFPHLHRRLERRKLLLSSLQLGGCLAQLALAGSQAGLGSGGRRLWIQGARKGQAGAAVRQSLPTGA